MKANLRFAVSLTLPLLMTLSVSCSERPVEPIPTPAPTPASIPKPRPVPKIDWREARVTPGDWQWSAVNGQSTAQFAGGKLALRCDQRGKTITLLRSGTATGRVPVTVLTKNLTRPLSGTGQRGAIAVILTARDPLLDAMAFSRGHFAIETAGLPTLYVPSWPEVSRVIEDCR